MPAVQRQVTAFAAVALAMLLAAACGAPRRTDVALSSDAAPPDSSTTAAAPASTTTIVVATTSAPPTSAASTSAPSTSASSTTMAGALDDSQRSTLSGGSSASTFEQVDAAEAALDRGDICGVYTGLAEIQLDAVSTDHLLTQLTRIRDLMITATSIAPASLVDDWTTLTDGTADMVASLEADSAADSKVATHFDDDAFRAASKRVESWMGRQCG